MRSIKYGVLAIFLLLLAQGYYTNVEVFIDDQSNLNPLQTVQCFIYMGIYFGAMFCAALCLVTSTKPEDKNEQKNSTGND